MFLIKISFKKNYQLELVSRCALEINPTVAGMSNSDRNANNLAIENTYNKTKILSNIKSSALLGSRTQHLVV